MIIIIIDCCSRPNFVEAWIRTTCR